MATNHTPYLEKGLISIFTGEGKGKTSAAVGTSVRAAGHGLRVCLIFFAKGKRFDHGEFKILSSLPNVTLQSFGQSGWILKNISEETRKQAELAFEAASEAVTGGQYDLVVMDEIMIALTAGLVTTEQVIRMINAKPPYVELIMTGRSAPAELVELADLVSEIKAVKHPYTRGIKARKGIDY
ncbi:cob(I)yrinic acid a,c-diamide adenosyltransferase [Dehalococcoides mccartyi]|uniref:cob(I)yrinic acid a,c-diamide adenosyltransferase n=1 Tax=Dehalococcoides mccartyi TaxID=61435 RepID=UPI0004E05179|nr:cob(I)yrinic acid a,c-diamide adenosyltransferase [Dehalococcoides mccartyi]AII58178.1 cob(I)alamin adenosyltransferase [Dehalococcoides mccartyi CG1]APH13209.1 cob(I)alamin adenolsyltransferase [Dehalococcoides mccartyi]